MPRVPQRTAVGAPTHGPPARMRLLVASGIWLARLPDNHCWRRRAPAPSYSRYQRLQRLKRPPPPFHAPQRPTTDTLDCPVAPAPLPLRVPASSTRKCPPSLRPPSTPRRAHLGTCPSPAKCPPQSPMPVLQHGSGSEEVRQCSMPPLDPTHLPAGATIDDKPRPPNTMHAYRNQPATSGGANRGGVALAN